VGDALSIAQISTTQLPADVRAAGAHGRKLYEAALGFEQQLVQSLASQMAATTDPSDSDSDGDSDSADGSSSDAASGVIREQLPDALASGITASGGLGLAHELYVSMKRSGK
jgi:hypothetical protein